MALGAVVGVWVLFLLTAFTAAGRRMPQSLWSQLLDALSPKGAVDRWQRREERVFRDPPLPLYGLPPVWEGPRFLGGMGWGGMGRGAGVTRLELAHGDPGDPDGTELRVSSSVARGEPEPPEELILRELAESLWHEVHRPPSDLPPERFHEWAGAREQEHGGWETPRFTPVEIPVDGAPGRFAYLMEGSAWVAIGRADDVTITLRGRNIDAGRVELVTVEDVDPYIQGTRHLRERTRIESQPAAEAEGPPALGGEERGIPVSVWLVAAGAAAVELALSPLYGYHRDELYFLAAGRRMAWGYVDQPPLTPALARLSDVVIGGSLPGLRVWSALALGGIVILAAMLARELGGGRRAALLAAGSMAASTLFLTFGHLLSTATFDALAWVVVLFLVARLLRGADPRLWVAVGGVGGVALLNKHLVALLTAGLLAGLVLGRRAELLRSPWPWVGLVVAGIIAAPNLVWQAQHGWPQGELAASVAEETGGPPGTILQLLFLPLTLNPVLLPIWVWGLVWLLRDLAAREFRPLGWVWVFVAVLTVAVGGKFYYVAPATVPLLAAGSVALERRLMSRNRSGRAIVAGVLASGLVLSPLGLPVLPTSWLPSVPVHEVNPELGEMIGWPQLVERVVGVHRSLSEEERAGATILTLNYGEAAAIERFGPRYGLPAPASGHNNYWLWGPPDGTAKVLIAVGQSRSYLERLFEDVRLAATHRTPYGIENEEDGAPIWICRKPRGSWEELWTHIKGFSA